MNVSHEGAGQVACRFRTDLTVGLLCTEAAEPPPLLFPFLCHTQLFCPRSLPLPALLSQPPGAKPGQPQSALPCTGPGGVPGISCESSSSVISGVNSSLDTGVLLPFWIRSGRGTAGSEVLGSSSSVTWLCCKDALGSLTLGA